MSSNNKKVTQLVELTDDEVQPNDWLLIIDATARESKKIQASSFASWLNASGSFYTIHADTASYVFGGSVFGPVTSAAFAAFSTSASWADNAYHANYADSASTSQTASFALNAQGLSITSSYLSYQGFPNGTASFALRVEAADTANTAAFLLYYGGNNGTSSYSITTKTVNHAVTSDTASYVNNTVPINHASYADNAGIAINAGTSNFLIFSPNNGTASYAIKAGSVGTTFINYGMFLPTTQSSNITQIDSVDILPSSQTNVPTLIESIGNVIIPFTSSIDVNESMNMFIIDRNTGIQTVLDSTPIFFQVTPIINTWGSLATGSIKIPYTLIGQSNLNGKYLLFISPSSPNIGIDTSRDVKFNINSYSDILNTHSDSILDFYLSPSNFVVITFTTSLGQFTDNLTGLLITGSSNILMLDVSNQNVSSIKQIWKLSNLTVLGCSNNSNLTQLSGLPNSLTYFSCSNCSLTSLPSLSNTSVSYLDCSKNNLTVLPNFSSTMSYIDCSHNNISYIPNPLPYGIKTLFANNNILYFVQPTLPDSLVSMSINSNFSFDPNFVSIPTSMSFFDCGHTSIVSLPNLSGSNISQLYLQNTSLIQSSIDNICSQLVLNANKVPTGSLDLTGNGMPSIQALTNINTLVVNYNWTVLHD